VEWHPTGKRSSNLKTLQAYLLLHGLQERGRRIFRKLSPYLPEGSLILSPDAPFPYERGFTWYFFDRATQTYQVPMSEAIGKLKIYLEEKNPENLPLTVIGFSQGGYLAPVLAHELSNVKLVMGLGCEFRNNLIPDSFSLPLLGLHGEDDKIVPPAWAREQIQKLKERHIDCKFSLVPETGHEINSRMGLAVKKALEEHGKF
jgi:predicted esterase